MLLRLKDFLFFNTADAVEGRMEVSNSESRKRSQDADEKWGRRMDWQGWSGWGGKLKLWFLHAVICGLVIVLLCVVFVIQLFQLMLLISSIPLCTVLIMCCKEIFSYPEFIKIFCFSFFLKVFLFILGPQSTWCWYAVWWASEFSSVWMGSCLRPSLRVLSAPHSLGDCLWSCSPSLSVPF